MSGAPFLTILTASLNSGKTLRRNLVSVRGQIFKDFEHIVVDGGSADETREILKSLTGSYDLTWTSEPDRGIAHALNKGLKQARGRYVLVVHADDHLLDEYTLTTVYPALRSQNLDICAFPVILDCPSRGHTLLRPKRLIWWHHFKTVFLHQGTFVHRRVFDRIGGFDEQFSIAFDYDFFYRALVAGFNVRLRREPVAFMGGTGLSHQEKLLRTRVIEEFRIQERNEKKVPWKMLQLLFRGAYFPLKMRFFPLVKGVRSSKNGLA